tara:strand:+ start:104 stop:784 length:681 start_codon:yes stop_codon:yes gene_type:complete
MSIRYEDCDKGEAPCIYHTVIEQVALWKLPPEQKLIDIAEDQVAIIVPPEQDANIEALIANESWSSLRVPFKDITDEIDLLSYTHKYMGDSLKKYLQESGLISNGYADYFNVMNGLINFLRKEDFEYIQEVIDHILGPESKPYERVRNKLHEFRHIHSTEEGESHYILIAEGRFIGHDNFKTVAEQYLTHSDARLWRVALIHGAGSKIDFDLVNKLNVPSGIEPGE